MSRSVLLEISVESAERAAAAERGGADRIELCASLAERGLTPPVALLKAVRVAVRIPVFAMIRPRAGDFVYSQAEFTEMHKSIALARELGMDGLVLGILTSDRRVDTIHTREFVEAAQGMPVTFHRAVDEAADVLVAAEAIAQTGATRILTSGGKPSALEGANTIAGMVKSSRGVLQIVAGYKELNQPAGAHQMSISVPRHFWVEDLRA